MSNSIRNVILEEIEASIDLPDSAYEKAENRYKDLGGWFGRPEARCQRFDPHIYSQGSFRLGTVVRPLNAEGEYDLDLGCRLRVGISKASFTQKQLKNLVGLDLEDYRVARRFDEKKVEKHRCWRLIYADTLKFHLDTVPSIPETPQRRQLLQEAIFRAGTSLDLARVVANHTGAITDNRLPNYETISNDWRLSNSEGFALWFQSRMKLAEMLMENRAIQAKAAKVDDLPAYKWKSPLQASVQLLKRHRDHMFRHDDEAKPASIIITTLAARAYNGETDIADALRSILSGMGKLVNETLPRVPNPVNPAEDFADRWYDADKRHLSLEANFWKWLKKAQSDFDALETVRKPELIVEAANSNFGAPINAHNLKQKLGLLNESLLKPAVGSALTFPDKPLIPKKPAGFA